MSSFETMGDGRGGGGKWVRGYDVVYKKINRKGGSLGKRNICDIGGRGLPAVHGALPTLPSWGRTEDGRGRWR